MSETQTSARVRRPRSLRAQVAALISVSVVAVLAVVGVAVDRVTAVSARERLRTEAVDRMSTAVWILEQTGRVGGGATSDPSVPPRAVTRAIGGGRTVTYFDGRWMWAATPAVTGGALTIRLDGRDLAEHRRALTRALVLWGAVAGAAVAGLGALAAGRVVRPLREAASRSISIAAGDHSVRMIENGPAEVTDLARSINRMVDTLAARLDAERHFTADAAHELRTPLTALVSSTELLGDGAASALVRRQVNRLRLLVGDLLELQRAELDTVDTDPAGRLGGTLADAVLGAVHALDLSADDIVVHAVGGREPIPGLVDARVVRIVANLVANARMHGRPPIEITVGDRWFRVADHGDGLPDWLVERGPQRFAKRTGSPGVGLGLTIASAHAAAMGGTVELVAHQPMVTVRFHPIAAGVSDRGERGD